jgi:hypothetical protein
MTDRAPFSRPGLGLSAYVGYSFFRAIIGVFSAGAVFYEAHTKFLKYYEREWMGVQIRGPNDCMGVDRIANGDLFSGQTFCNQPENFVPWIVIYQNHWQAAVVFYGAIVAVMLAVAGLWWLLQSRRRAATPTVQEPQGSTANDGMI